MTWLEVALVVGVLLGAGCGAALVVRNPSFWTGLLSAAVAAVLPEVIRVVTTRMSPEEEREMREAYRAGRGDEWERKRRGAPPKG
jgi:hypothetical protein